MTDSPLVIVAGVRTPFCKAGTDLAELAADELGRIVVNALLASTGLDPSLIDEVIFGCVCQPAEAINVARVIALRAGIPDSVPAATVHRNCASGFEAVTTAHQRALAGQGSVFLVGGTESMSQVPLFLKHKTVAKLTAIQKAKTITARLGAITNLKPADFTPRVGLLLGLTDPVSGLNMGQTAELLARENDISREEQDAFALLSHQRAAAATDRFSEEIVPVYVNGRAVTADNGIRPGQSMEALAKLSPVFDRKLGTVTAGNSSQITDGAVALLVMTEKRAGELGFEPLGTLVRYAYTGCDPARMGLGPVSAIAKLGVAGVDADLVEINEAFAAQIISVQRKLDPPMPEEKLNVNGGAIALGHPVGATGARLILTSLLELRRRGAKRALLSLCVGGGQGAALWLERL
jgi:acetyl-CoA acetyltransferase family protein